MPNRRVFYGVYAVGIAPYGSTTYTPVHGLQSVGLTTTFNLEQVFEIGQVNIYENIEGLPDVELTLEKVLDGYPPIYTLATRQGSSASLTGRSGAQCSVAMSVFNDTNDSASGTPLAEVNMSGMYTSSLSWNFPVDGNFTESVTLVGNSKVWKSAAYTFSGSLFNNLDEPLALTSGVGGVNRREDLIFAPVGGVWTGSNYTILPGGTNGIPGISTSGTNDLSAGVYGAAVQRIGVSTNLGRTNINELGHRNPYFRYVEFPVEVTCEIEVLSKQGDGVSCTEEGVAGSGQNLIDKQIKIVAREGTILNLGTKNKLSNVSETGGDATGGNRSVTYTYSNFNILGVTHPQDPAGLS
jgi:hypothetical protein